MAAIFALFLPLLASVALGQQCPGHRPALLCHCDTSSLSCSGSQTSLPNLNLLDLIFNYTTQSSFLVTIRLSVQGLSTLPSGGFSGLTQLRYLVISNTKYPSLDSNVFDGLVLHTLSLKFNAFSLVPASSLWHLNQLETLDLSFNRITAIRSDDFSGLSALRRLDLSHNQISQLASGTFTSVPNLVELMLQENLLENLRNESFAGLSQLSTLFLSSNLFTQLDSRVFSPLTSLENLYLGHNPLGGLVRLELPSLKTLCMKNNSLCCTLEKDIFSGVPHLTVLMLSHNQLTSVAEEALKPLAGLLWLDLSFNMLSKLQGPVFSSASHLLDLELQHNVLETLEGPVFAGLSSLENLNLAGNQLKEWSCAAAADLPNMKELNFANNQLSSLVAGPFQLSRQLSSLHLQGNPFSCTCGLMPFARYLRSSQLTVRSKQSAKCEDPAGSRVLDLQLDCLESDPPTCRNSPDLRPRLEILARTLNLQITSMEWDGYHFQMNYALLGANDSLPVQPLCKLVRLTNNATTYPEISVPCPTPTVPEVFKLIMPRVTFSRVCLYMELAPRLALEKCSDVVLTERSNGLQIYLNQLLPNVTLNLDRSNPEATLLRWTISELDPLDSCVLKLGIFLADGTNHEKQHPCRNGSEYLSGLQINGACLTITFTLLDRHITKCSNFPQIPTSPPPGISLPIYPIIAVSTIFAVALLIIVILLIRVTCQKRTSREVYKVHFERERFSSKAKKPNMDEENFLYDLKNNIPTPSMTTFRNK